ncbi:hypothetical protein [Pseudomonas jilinensis]|uniref:Integrase n=1 Tax=Pseudomonas jilinensis TaxID=2078689 RepID=A0A396RZ59_9PSED|nr:hypothetical protein [Pseudomonas jilinensis]RHW21914.1 hypothetical protein C2846_05485 [Pseudomonas jilinensis]
MKPSALKSGDWLAIRCGLGQGEYRAQFIERIPAKGKGCPAKSVIRNPDWAGLDGPDDHGVATISDYDLARRGRLLEGGVA